MLSSITILIFGHKAWINSLNFSTVGTDLPCSYRAYVLRDDTPNRFAASEIVSPLFIVLTDRLHHNPALIPP